MTTVPDGRSSVAWPRAGRLGTGPAGLSGRSGRSGGVMRARGPLPSPGSAASAAGSAASAGIGRVRRGIGRGLDVVVGRRRHAVGPAAAKVERLGRERLQAPPGEQVAGPGDVDEVVALVHARRLQDEGRVAKGRMADQVAQPALADAAAAEVLVAVMTASPARTSSR